MPGSWVTSARYSSQRALEGRSRVLGVGEVVGDPLRGSWDVYGRMTRVSCEAGYDAEEDQLGLSPNLCSAATA
jgi:hypothetical protein